MSMNQRWKKGGPRQNGLRSAGQVWNYFTSPGRTNIIPDATRKRVFNSKDPISSIGVYTTRGTKQVASGTYGPGTLNSTNVQVKNQNIQSEYSHGYQRQNIKRSQFVDYRSTDPILIENLRKNPLSIYAVGDAKNAPIPAFETYTRPENYNTIKSIPMVDINQDTIQQGIDGSPQVNILGLNKQNPFLGLTQQINSEPEFLGKTYGGTNGDAKPYAKALYNSAWKNNQEQTINNPNHIFPFTNNNEKISKGCKNDALVYFAQGYNIADQINTGTTSIWVNENNHSVNNLPWGPKKITNNPLTQIGGIWNGQSDVQNTKLGYENKFKNTNNTTIFKPIQNCYKGKDRNQTLIC
jgi:hypothetical protein